MMRDFTRRTLLFALAVLGLSLGTAIGQEAKAWESGPGYKCSSPTSCGPGLYNCTVECEKESALCTCTIN
jgi:hypothetical protein